MYIIENVKRKKKLRFDSIVLCGHFDKSYPINRKAQKLEKNLFEQINLYINVQKSIYNI